jgi:HK97 family phage portal protein
LERTDDTPDDATVREDELLSQLFREPNPYMSWASLVEHLVIDFLLVGNAYWYKWRPTESGKPLAIYRLAPSHVKVVPGALGVEKYEYQPPGVRDEDKLEITPDKMVHFKLPNPHSAYFGLGLIQGGARALDLELALTDAQAAYYENKADPSLIVQSERRVPRDVFNKLRAQLRARASGTKKAGELLVLEAGLQASTLSPTARDALYSEAGKFSRDRIFEMFRASPMLFGIVDEAGGGNKITDARREFDTYVMRPFLKKLGECITISLLKPWDLSFKFNYNYVIPPEELVKLSGDFASIPGVKVREVRRFLLPTGVLDGESTGDEEIDNMVLNLPGEELDEDGQGGFADRPLPGEAGRPPLGENTRSFGSARVRRPAAKALSFDDAVADWKALTFEPPARTTIGNRLPDEQRPPDVADRDRDGAVDDAAASMLSGMRRAALTLERGLLDHVEGKALGDRIRNSESWKTFSNLLGEAMMDGARSAASNAVIQQGSLGRVPQDEIDYDTLAREIAFRPEGVRSITSTLKDLMLKDIADAENPEAAVRSRIALWSDSYAKQIALDTSVQAYSEGTITVAESTGATGLLVSEHDDAQDDECIEANGQVWDFDKARKNRQAHSRCRRSFVPVA